jgi:hypothetical protein
MRKLWIGLGVVYYPRKQTSVSYAADCDATVCYGGPPKSPTSILPRRSIVLTTRFLNGLQRREQRRPKRRDGSFELPQLSTHSSPFTQRAANE